MTAIAWVRSDDLSPMSRRWQGLWLTCCLYVIPHAPRCQKGCCGAAVRGDACGFPPVFQSARRGMFAGANGRCAGGDCHAESGLGRYLRDEPDVCCARGARVGRQPPLGSGGRLRWWAAMASRSSAEPCNQRIAGLLFRRLTFRRFSIISAATRDYPKLPDLEP